MSRRARRLVCAGAAVGVSVALQLVGGAGAASAAGPWTKQDAPAAGLYGIDCPSQVVCRAVGLGGLIRATDDAGVHWRSQDSRTTAELAGISCGGEATCVAVGAAGTVLTTADGGLTWTRRSAGVSENLAAVDCPTPATCYAVGNFGAVVKTTDAGETWTQQGRATNQHLFGVSCATPASCVAVGWGGTIATTSGSGWALQDTGSTFFMSVACPAVAVCYAVGSGGTVARSDDLGATWEHRSVASSSLYGISCPSAGHCVATGDGGAMVETVTGGTSWSRQPSGATGQLRAVSCADDAACWTVQSTPNGAIHTNSAGGTANAADDAAQALAGTLVGSGTPSNDCAAPDATLVDGYFGSLYARLRLQNEGTESWACTRLQYESGDLIAGGKVIAVDGSPVTRDGAYGACSTQSGNAIPGGHPPATGAVGEPGDPHYVPYLLDTYTNTREAWLCLRAGVVGTRLAFNGAAVFERDDAGRVTAPARVPWRAGQPSSLCESRTEGGRSRLVNAVVSGTQVWITAWQSANLEQAELCFRAEGAGRGGGRLTVDTSASPGVKPVIEAPRSDAAGCTKTAFHDDANGVAVRHSAVGAMPASVCLTAGGSTVRFTVGVTGSAAVPPVVGFQADA